MNKKNIRDLSYTAGVMDSDGCFVIGRTIRNKSRYCNPQIVVQQIDTRILNFLFGKWSGTIKKASARSRSDIRVNGKKIHCNDTFVWYIQTVDECLKFCKKIIPFLKIKKRQAELMYQFCCLKEKVWKRCGKKFMKGRGGSPIIYTEQEIQKMDEIYEKMRIEKQTHFQKFPQNIVAAETKRENAIDGEAIVQL